MIGYETDSKTIEIGKLLIRHGEKEYFDTSGTRMAWHDL